MRWCISKTSASLVLTIQYFQMMLGCTGFYIQPNLLDVTVEPVSQAVCQGCPLELKCSVALSEIDPALPPPIISWTLNDSYNIEQNDKLNLTIETYTVDSVLMSVLSSWPSVEHSNHSSGVYRCIVTDGGEESMCAAKPCVPTAYTSQPHVVDVLMETEPLQFKTVSLEDTVLLDPAVIQHNLSDARHTFFMDCGTALGDSSASALPGGASYTETLWYYNGAPLVQSGSSGQPNITVSSSDPFELYGVYQCFVESLTGGVASGGVVSRAVRVLPSGWTNPPRNLQCRELIHPNPPLVQVSWDPPSYTGGTKETALWYHLRVQQGSDVGHYYVVGETVAYIRLESIGLTSFYLSVVAGEGGPALSEEVGVADKYITCCCCFSAFMPPSLALHRSYSEVAVEWSNSEEPTDTCVSISCTSPLTGEVILADNITCFNGIHGTASWNTLTTKTTTNTSSYYASATLMEEPAVSCRVRATALPVYKGHCQGGCRSFEYAYWNQVDTTFFIVFEHEKYEVREGEGRLNVCLTAVGEIEEQVEVFINTAAITARGSDVDYSDLNERAFLSADVSKVCASIGVADDSVLEYNETFTVSASAEVAVENGIILLASTTVVILDDDSELKVIRNETVGTLELCAPLELLEGSDGTANSSYIYQDGTALANVDFVLGSGFLRTDKDANSVICCVVSILDDAVNETDETFIAVLTYDPQLSDISPLTVMFEVTVIDNDVLVLEELQFVVTEGNSFAVCISSLRTLNTTVIVEIKSDGLPVSDNMTLDRQVILPPHSLRNCTTVALSDDNTVGHPQTQFELQADVLQPPPIQMAEAFSRAKVTVLEVSVVTVSWNETSVTADEGDSVSLCASYSGQLGRPLQINITANRDVDTATVGDDFVLDAEVLEFGAPAEANKQQCVSISIVSDSILEGAEQFTVSMETNDTAARLVHDSATITISDLQVRMAIIIGSSTVAAALILVGLCASVLVLLRCWIKRVYRKANNVVTTEHCEPINLDYISTAPEVFKTDTISRLSVEFEALNMSDTGTDVGNTNRELEATQKMSLRSENEPSIVPGRPSIICQDSCSSFGSDNNEPSLSLRMSDNSHTLKIREEGSLPLQMKDGLSSQRKDDIPPLTKEDHQSQTRENCPLGLQERDEHAIDEHALRTGDTPPSNIRDGNPMRLGEDCPLTIGGDLPPLQTVSCGSNTSGQSSQSTGAFYYLNLSWLDSASVDVTTSSEDNADTTNTIQILHQRDNTQY